MQGLHLFKLCHSAEAVRPLLHFFAQLEPIGPFRETGVIIHILCGGHLPAG